MDTKFKESKKHDSKLARVIDFGDDSDKGRFIVASNFYTDEKPQKDFFKDRGVNLKDDDSLFYCLSGTYTTDDAGGGSLMKWFKKFTDANHDEHINEILRQKAEIKKTDGSKLFTNSKAKADSADAKSRIFQFNCLINSKDTSKGNFIYGISPDFRDDFKGLDAKSVMRKWGYHFRKNIEELLKEQDSTKVKIVIPVFSGGYYLGSADREELIQGMLEGLFLYEKENSTCKKFTFLLSGFNDNEDEIKKARENLYSSDNPLKEEKITSITSKKPKSWNSIEKIETKQAKKAESPSPKEPEKSSEKKPKTVEKDEMLNYALRAYLLDYKGNNSQEHFNTQFDLDSDKPTPLDHSKPQKITREQYQEYLNKKLLQADSGVDKRAQYLQSFESKTTQSDNRRIHSGLHAFLTAQYAEACLNLYRQYKIHFLPKLQKKIEQFDNDPNKLEELKFLVAMHDIARTQHGHDKDEHKNAFYVALILEQKFNKTREEAIELALHVACKSSGDKKDKTLFSILIQSADSIAYSRVGSGTDFDKKKCDIYNDFFYFFSDKTISANKKPQIFKSFQKSFAEFTKKTESLEKALIVKGKYSKEIEVGQEPKRVYESFFKRSDQDEAIKTNYEEIVKMSSDFLTKKIETFSFKASSSIVENDEQKKEFFRLMCLDERMDNEDSGGVTKQDFEKLSKGKSTKQQDSAEIVEKVLGAFALNKNKYVTKYSPKDKSLVLQYKKKEAKEEDTLLIQIGSNYIAKINEVFNEEVIDETLEDENNVEFEKSDSSDKELLKTNQNSKYKITGDEFCVQLKRFDVTAEGPSTKINTPFTNKKLSIKKEGDKDKKDYSPTAFIVHSGGSSVNYDHYVCYVKCKDNKWYCIDDDRVHQVEGRDTDDGLPNQLKQAYIVKYSNQQVQLPDKELFEQGYTNRGNDCYANASLNFLKSLTSTLPTDLVFETTKKEESKSRGDASKGKEGSESYDDDDSEAKHSSKESKNKSTDSKKDDQEHQDAQGSSPYTDEDQKMMAILKKRPFTIEEMLDKHNEKFGSVLQKPKIKFDLEYDKSTKKFTLTDSKGLTKTISKKKVDEFEKDIKTKGKSWKEINEKYQEFRKLKRQGKSKEEAEQETKLPGKYIKILQVINLVNQGKSNIKSS